MLSNQQQFIFENKHMIELRAYCSTEIGRRAEIFDRENPGVYALLQRFCGEVRARGYKKYSVNSIFERIRWHTDIETNGKTFKLSNNHRAYYARKLMAHDERYEGFFEIREEKGQVICDD